MALEAITPAFKVSQPYPTTNQRETKDINNTGILDNNVNVLNTNGKNVQADEFIIDKKEIMSILFLGLPAIPGRKVSLEGLHTIDIFA